MIAGTYLGSAALVAVLGLLLRGDHLTTASFMALVVATFFLASAGASSAYLTVSEVFPMETRALAIALFYAVGTAAGGIAGPVIFGALIHSGDAGKVATGFFIGAAAMAIGGLAELRFGVRAEQQSLEDIARPLSAEDADGAAGDDGREALRLRERAETERATAARHRAARHDAAAGLAPAPAAGLVVLEIRAQVAELRALALDALARGCDERAAGRRSGSDAERSAALDRAARSDERARDYTERADALAAEHGVGGGQNDGPARAAGGGDDAETRWAQARTARERALAARARHDEAAAAHEDKDAHAHGQLALAAEERAEASGHDAQAARLHADAGDEEPAVRHRREAERAARIDARRARQRAGMRRFRPGVGTVLFSPGMLGTAGPSSRFAAEAEAEHDREVEAIARALADGGGAGRSELLRRVGGRHWGPGRFTSALRAALREGRARRDAGGRYEASGPKPAG
jgi:hypothetical protein